VPDPKPSLSPVPEDSQRPPVLEASQTADRGSAPSPVPQDSQPSPVPEDSPDLEHSAPRRRPPVAEASPAPDPAAIDRFRERIRGLRMLLGLLVLLGLAAMQAATRSAPRGTGERGLLLAHLGLWLAVQLAAIALLVLGLRWLRRRRFGARPSTRLRRPSDVLLHLDAGLGGAVALIGFGPAILGPNPSPLDWLIAAAGVLLLAVGLRAAVLHVTRE
jgi:hypothetical protein